MRPLRSALIAAAAIAIGLVGALLMAELVLRILPVNEGLRAQAVTAAQPVFHFEPSRQAIFAKGAAFNIVNRVRTNGAGFVSDQEYQAQSDKPLLAVIGDSFVEALMVPYPETIQARLADAVKDKGRVYAFAASGAGLSQYLVWARHARDTYRPRAVTFVIIPNDFSESLASRERSPGFHSFVRRPDDSAELSLTEYHPSLLRKLLRHSALAMYLFTQAKVQSLMDVPLHLGGTDTRYVGNVQAEAPEEYVRQAKWAVDRFLDLAPDYAGLPADRIQLVVEGIRPELYDPKGLAESQGSFWATMRRYVIDQATARGFEAIDMNPPFIERYARDGKRFEFPTDGHWNGEGHAVAAEAVRASRVFKALFGN